MQLLMTLLTALSIDLPLLGIDIVSHNNTSYPHLLSRRLAY